MPGRNIPLLPRQTLLQDAATSTVYYSDTFDLSSDASIMLEARVYALHGTSTPTVQIDFETTSNLRPGDSQWYLDHQFNAITSTASGAAVRGQIVSGGSPMGRFGRVKITLTGDSVATTLEVIGVTRTQ